MSRTPIKSWTKKDFIVKPYIGSGPGGQHRNKVATCIRITEIETGLSASCESHKSQHQNKCEAFRKLMKLLIAHHFPKQQKERAPCTTRIRTYHEPRATITDHRTKKNYTFDHIVYGNGIDSVIEDCIKHGIDPE